MNLSFALTATGRKMMAAGLTAASLPTRMIAYIYSIKPEISAGAAWQWMSPRSSPSVAIGMAFDRADA
ncbi:hypothetical protein [Paracoccus sp. SSK6]|uniref:hypothetical protein n=1 Tax=Paracoccus sp. SSK6 TaxID=3143131 RepID=UPI00321AD893